MTDTIGINTQAPVGSAPNLRRGPSRARVIIVGVIIVGAMGFLLFKALGSATVYFRTADEAVRDRQALGEQRFRLEGTVVNGSIKANGIFTDFAVTSKDTTVQVHNSGQPLGIFQDNIPVVLEGRFAPGTNDFNSDLIMVKHTSDYAAKHPDRVSGRANQ